MAIAFDAATQGGFTSGTSHTFSHTCTGDDRILFVQSFHNNANDWQTGVTYNGVSMTLVNKSTPASSRYVYLWYLIAPATGANNVVITGSSSAAYGGNASSYTGADQTTQPDASSVTSTSTTPSVSSVTTIADNCWTILAVIGNNANSTASTNSTLRAANATYADGDLYDNNGAITPAGSYSMTVTHAGGHPLSRIMASFAPAVAVADNNDIKNHSTLDTDIISYWDLQEPSGTRYDLVGSNDLTDTNTVTSGTGKIGNCGDFEEANSEYLIKTSGVSGFSFGSGNLSVSIWLKRESNDARYPFSISNGSNKRVYIDVGSTYTDFQVYDGSNGALARASAMTIGDWTHVVGVRDGGNMKIYINGSYVTQNTFVYGTPSSTNVGTLDEVCVGARAWTPISVFHDGLADEVGVWDKALTSDEITDLYNSGDGIPYYLPADVKNDTGLSTNLTAYWELDDNTDSHSTYTLTESGSPTYTTGKSGDAIDLEDGSSQYCTATNGFNSTTQSFSTWFKAESLNGSYSPSIISTYDNGNKDGFYMRYNYTDKKLYFELRDTGSSARTLTSTSAISAGTWYHVVVAWNTSEGKLYIDGVLDATQGTWGTMDASSNNLYLGNDANYTTRYFDGLIDETAIWSKKLGVDEVRALYGYGTPPVYEDDGGGGDPDPIYNALAMSNF